MLQFVPPTSRLAGQVIVSESAVTEGQQQLITAIGLPPAPRDPFSVVVSLSQFPSGQEESMTAVLAALILELKAAPQGVPLMPYWVSAVSPPPPTFRSYERSIDPAGQLTPAPYGQPACTAGPGTVMGSASGRISPVRIYFAMHSTVNFGFSSGQFFVESTGSGYDQIFWYTIPGIVVPANSL